MKEFKIKKDITKEPFLWGMKISFFLIFLSILAICLFYLIANLSFGRIIICLAIATGSFLLLQIISKFNMICWLFSDKFPDEVKK